MGNHNYKKEQARIFNEDRAYELKRKAERKADMLANPEKYKRKPRQRRKVQAFIAAASVLAVSTPTVSTVSFEDDNSPKQPKFDEPPKPISNWVELAEVGCNDLYRLDITPEDGNGWIRDEEGGYIEYLSTHTFYGRDYEYSTRLLQTYGFNVVLENWDKKD